MHTELCDRFGIDYPIFAFTPSEKVAAAASRAGGLGVLGCVRFNEADDLEAVLQWMDENTDGKPYGVDVVMPAKIPTEGAAVDLNRLIPQAHRDFVDKTLADLGVPPLPSDGRSSDGVLGWLHSVARSHVEVALKHPIKLIANALGSPPNDVTDQAHRYGVPVAALAGTAEHARRHVDNGVDMVVAQGHEAGGHTGEIASMVLVPEVVEAATSSDTVRRRIYTGKPARLLKSRRTDAWDAPGVPEPLPMPLQNLLVSESHQWMNASTDPTVVAMPVGQIVGRMKEIRPVGDIIAGLVREFEATARRLYGIAES
ncbi:MAG TPA: nitronate monooxygenase [Mycobacterium sp.]|nr:nitronate monooxygenase [Mycobacterium sp.]